MVATGALCIFTVTFGLISGTICYGAESVARAWPEPVVLRPGDRAFIPAGVWHFVVSDAGTVAVNIDLSGSSSGLACPVGDETPQPMDPGARRDRRSPVRYPN